MQCVIEPFYHSASSTISYVVYCPTTRQAAVIDAALDFDVSSGEISSACVEPILELIQAKQLQLCWILETHAHADHISAAQYLKTAINKQKNAEQAPQTAIGKNITFAQQTFKTQLNLPASFATDGRQFDKLLNDGDNLNLGEHTIKVVATPGHTNDSVTFVIGDNAFVGDTLFMPDSGTSRCDFPGGDAKVLFDSIQTIYDLGEQVKLWMCHDYQPGGRELKYQTTVSEQRKHNIHLSGQTAKEQFVELREKRDATLNVPKLLYPSIQLNIDGGRLPPAEDNQVSYIKIPLTRSNR